MTKEKYKQLYCANIGIPCGFQVRAKTEREIRDLTKMHANEAHGMKEIWPKNKTEDQGEHSQSSTGLRI